MLIYLLLIYSLVVSYCLVRKQSASSKSSELDNIWKRLTANANPSGEDIKSIAEIAKVRQSEIPWYERSLSTIGIVAFFSMLIATSIQTISTTKAEIESTRLRQEVKELESQRSSWERLTKSLSEVILLKQTSEGKLHKSEEELLRHRLVYLERIEDPGKEDEAERLKIYLALKQYDNATTLIDNSKILADETTPENLIFLAEVCFVDGAKARAKSMLKKFEIGLSNQPVNWQLRYFILSSALSSDSKAYSKEVAALMHIQVVDAEEWLDSKVNELKEQAKRRSLSTDNGRQL